MYKGYPREQHARNTGAIPGQFAGLPTLDVAAGSSHPGLCIAFPPHYLNRYRLGLPKGVTLAAPRFQVHKKGDRESSLPVANDSKGYSLKLRR